MKYKGDLTMPITEYSDTHTGLCNLEAMKYDQVFE